MPTTLEEAKNYINSIDFTEINNKLVNYGGWRRKDVMKTCEQYRRFLFLMKKYDDGNGTLPPSEDMDEFWHSHILDTVAYIRDCQAIFGKYMHHYPYFGIDGKSDMNSLNNAFEKTKELYRKEFSEPILATRSHYPAVIYYFLKKFEQLLMT